MKKIIYICCIGLALVALNSCKQDKNGPVVKDNVAPGPVSNVTVQNLNGAAKLTYMVPNDADLLCVKASYTTKKGEVRESKVSRYNNNLVVVGFGDTSVYKVTLVAIDKSDNESSPVVVSVHPLKPAIKLVRDSLTIVADFGGVTINFANNNSRDNLAIVVLANDSLKHFSPIYTNYTNSKNGVFSVRGLPSTSNKFGVFVRDRWGNLSDTLIVMLTPVFEQLLDRTKMKGLVLPTDAPLGYGGSIAGLFDGDVTQHGSSYYHSGDAARMPQWFTFDMGVTAKLSRLSWFMRPGFFYDLHSPRVVKIWGSNNPNLNGSFDSSWILLTTHTQVKPSGLPNGQLSQADIDAANAGETVLIPLSAPKVRYIRFETDQNWSNGTYCNFTELMTWGNTN